MSLQFETPSVHRVTKITVGASTRCSDFYYRRITFENAAGETVEMTAYSSSNGEPIDVVCTAQDGEVE
jgi:hypothetical protein